METELARTFLTVVAAGNFVSAADRLHVTQSTVSARIHTLEEQLGCSLFVRNKAGTGSPRQAGSSRSMRRSWCAPWSGHGRTSGSLPATGGR